MAVGLEDIKKLRTMTGAGLGDCKKALAEAEATSRPPSKLSAKKDRPLLPNVLTAKHRKVAYSAKLKTESVRSSL